MHRASAAPAASHAVLRDDKGSTLESHRNSVGSRTLYGEGQRSDFFVSELIALVNEIREYIERLKMSCLFIFCEVYLSAF